MKVTLTKIIPRPWLWAIEAIGDQKSLSEGIACPRADETGEDYDQDYSDHHTKQHTGHDFTHSFSLNATVDVISRNRTTVTSARGIKVGSVAAPGQQSKDSVLLAIRNETIT